MSTWYDIRLFYSFDEFAPCQFFQNLLKWNNFRDVTATKFPHSISVRLPNDEYQVVEFDGSTEVGQCLSSLCLKLGLRPALLSGYALYIENPATKSLVLLKGKQKVSIKNVCHFYSKSYWFSKMNCVQKFLASISVAFLPAITWRKTSIKVMLFYKWNMFLFQICDTLAAWEYQQRDTQRGRIHTDCAPLLSLYMRHYWRHLTALETPIERSFLVWRMADELVAGRMPISSQLADSLAALFAQVKCAIRWDQGKSKLHNFSWIFISWS